MEVTAKKCLECGDPVGKGKVYRKFCSVECKNKYHNKESYSEKTSIAQIKKILDKNRKILKKITSRKNAVEISNKRLSKEDLDFD